MMARLEERRAGCRHLPQIRKKEKWEVREVSDYAVRCGKTVGISAKFSTQRIREG